jgi:hypothetical protein
MLAKAPRVKLVNDTLGHVCDVSAESSFCCSTTAKQQLGLEARGIESAWHLLMRDSRGNHRRGVSAHTNMG